MEVLKSLQFGRDSSLALLAQKDSLGEIWPLIVILLDPKGASREHSLSE